jgi:phenylacetate-CoA ligase
VKRALALIPPAWRQRRLTRQVRTFLLASEFWPRETWRAYRDKKVRELVAYAYERVPYYREVWKAAGISPVDVDGVAALRRLPFIDNRILTAHALDLQARGVSPRHKIATQTGGTMGRPTRLLLHRRVSQDAELAFIQDLWRRVGYRAGARRIIIRVGGDPGTGTSKLYAFDPSNNTFFFRSYRLTDDKLALLIDLIRSFRPEYLHTYPSVATLLAQYVERHEPAGLPPLKAVLASSENSYPHQRELITRVLRTRFFTWYGHAEQAILAGECEHSSAYHIYPGYGVCELVDPAGRVVEQLGQPGELVGTGFYNPVMPIVRYRTGDFGTVTADECAACGRSYALLEHVVGHHTQELIVHREGHLSSVLGVLARGAYYHNVRQFQIHQKVPGELVFRIVKAERYGPEDEARFQVLIRERFGASMQLSFDYVNEIPPTAGGKWKYLIQEVDAGRTWAQPADQPAVRAEPEAGPLPAWPRQ